MANNERERNVGTCENGVLNGRLGLARKAKSLYEQELLFENAMRDRAFGVINRAAKK